MGRVIELVLVAGLPYFRPVDVEYSQKMRISQRMARAKKAIATCACRTWQS